MSLWDGRFKEKLNIMFEHFNKSLKTDVLLIEQDVTLSKAWSYVLYTIGIFKKTEQLKIEQELTNILTKAIKASVNLKKSNSEDIHTWVEYKLTKVLGSIGKKIHTGRSRNDQVTTDTKLWCIKEICLIIPILNTLQKRIVALSEKHIESIMPGYTHLQKAQPITFAHWCLAYNEMLLRDKLRIDDTLKRTSINPLGSGSISGTAYNIDREQLAKWLSFNTATSNSLDSISDRDYLIELIATATISIIHLSRLSEDLIFYNTEEANLVELTDKITSGSSLMPQKKNPDALELIKGKVGKIQGALTNIITILKGLPLAYNKDMQESKAAILDTITTWKECLHITKLIIINIKIRLKACILKAKQGYSNATELADYLVNKGIPFRKAHNITGKVVIKGIAIKTPIEELSIKTLAKINPIINKDVYRFLKVGSCIIKRSSKGGVSKSQTILAILVNKKLLTVSDSIYRTNNLIPDSIVGLAFQLNKNLWENHLEL
ncbi:argininosuccinate lyase [Candidatus Tremblaya phenacola]|uniref:Argininosuccinate lyase n=2 Tax=Candidatus Tremblayella phenacoccinincola TaxID=1010676 RepID=A0A2G0V6Z7_9PROT|nr:argininosuccinate lyase [Candidatus Tremblaya phenacola]PHN16241.1 Argininosuccinate lyase [Candidatus Tremblaya phenacola]